MVFISGIAGQLFRDQALTVTFALVFSLIVALTLIPMLAALGTGARYAETDEFAAPNRFTAGVAFIVRMFAIAFGGIAWLLRKILWVPSRVMQTLYSGAAHIYEPLLRWSLSHRAIILAVRQQCLSPP